MNNPFFSVIIPAYNAEGWIRRVLESVKVQSFTDYELIVVCDSCVDRTVEIAKEYTDKVFAIHEHLDGLARNKGIEEARGEWILFADDDDWFLHEYVFDQIHDMVGKHGEDVLLFGFIWRGRGYARQYPGQKYIAVWNKCWRRSCIGATRFPARLGSCDEDFHREMFQKDLREYYWDMPLYYYNYMRAGSITWRRRYGDIAVKYEEK